MSLLHPVSAQEIPFYVGTMTDHSASRGIYIGSLDAATGKLGPLRLANETKDPNFLALSPDLNYLYAAVSAHYGSAVVALKRGADGMLTLLNERPSGGEGTCHVSVDATGHNVLIANYEGGDIACFRTNADGSLGFRSAFMTFTGSGPNPQRQKKPYAHSIYTDPENRHVYACDLGSDHVWNYKLHAEDGTLVPNNPPAVKVPPGSGPRHLAFSVDGKFVYVANEMGLSVSSFSRDAASGRLTPLETVSTVPPGVASEDITVAEIVCHPSGKWLYVSNRGCNTIAVFSIAGDGRLTLIQSVSSIVNFPRSIALDPTGQWMITAGQKDSRIAVLKVDIATGLLAATNQTAEVGNPVCILFVPKTL